MLDEKDLQAIATLMDTKLDAQEKKLTAMMDTKLDAQEKKLTAIMDTKLDAQEKKLTAMMDTKLDAQKKELTAMMDTKLDTAKKEINEQTARDLRIIVEAEINPKFELVLEGYENLMQTLAPKSKLEALEEEVDFLREIVRNHSIDIAALKAK